MRSTAARKNPATRKQRRRLPTTDSRIVVSSSSNVVGCKCVRKVLLGLCDMRFPYVATPQSPSTSERLRRKLGGESAYLRVTQTDPACTVKHFRAGEAKELRRAARRFVVVHDARHEHNWCSE